MSYSIVSHCNTEALVIVFTFSLFLTYYPERNLTLIQNILLFVLNLEYMQNNS